MGGRGGGGIYHLSVRWGIKPGHFRAVIFATKAECWLDYRGKVQPSDGCVDALKPEMLSIPHVSVKPRLKPRGVCARSRAHSFALFIQQTFLVSEAIARKPLACERFLEGGRGAGRGGGFASPPKSKGITLKSQMVFGSYWAFMRSVYK